LSDQDRSTIDYQGLASAEFFLHQEQIGLRYIMGFANSANWKTVAHAFIQAFPFCCSHVLPEVRPNHSRRHRIYAYRRQLHREGARQGLDRSADTRRNYPSFMWSLPGNSGGEHDRATLSNTLASVFNSSQRCPIAQLERSPGLFKICVGKVLQMKIIASGEYQVVECTKAPKKRLDGSFV
jgi:hypothetical protein